MAMRKILVILSVFALLAILAGTQAHAGMPCDLSPQTSDSSHAGSGAAPDADMPMGAGHSACGGCHVHCYSHLSMLSNGSFSFQVSLKDKTVFFQESISLSSPVYGLKRPPKA